MKTTNNILSFENRVQVELFTCELQGQLSDGRWENSSPHDHWEPWCHAEVTYGKEVGRNFNVRRDGYCFTETSLLPISNKSGYRFYNWYVGEKAFVKNPKQKDFQFTGFIYKSVDTARNIKQTLQSLLDNPDAQLTLEFEKTFTKI